MDQPVKPATRLDTVVKLREKDEDRARIELAEAHQHVMTAERAAAAARVLAQQDGRTRGTAQDWEVTDLAHVRALREASQAERAVHAAGEKLVSKRRSYATAYQSAESVRRVADARRAEMVAEAESAERKEFDEIGAILHFRS